MVAVALALTSPAAFAAQPRHIRFDRISIEQGLSLGTVGSILQDRTGFMWFGTQDGLNRYDGNRFLVFKGDPKDPSTLSHNWVRALLEDASGDIWVGTLGGGLSRWHRATDSFTHYRHDPENPTSLSGDRVWALLQDRAGNLWIGTDQSGLDRFDAANGTFEHFRHDPSDPASLSNDSIRVLYEDRGGRIWVGTSGGGLNLFDAGAANGTFIHFRNQASDPASLSDDRVRSVLEDATGTLWIGTLGGLNRINASALQAGSVAFERVTLDPADPDNLSKARIRVLFEDRDGRLWIGTDDGLYLLADRASDSFVHYRHRRDDPTSLSMNRVASIYQDRGGVLWIGTEGGGLNKWHPRTWSFSNDSYQPSDLSSNNILSVTGDGSGHLWLGTNGHGLNRLHRASGTVTRFLYEPDRPGSLSDNRVTALLRDRQDTVWVGTIAGGLNRFDAATETFEHFAHDPERDDSLGANGVMTLHEDHQGNLWVGTFGGGLNRLEKGARSFVSHRHDPADPRTLSGDRVTTLAEEADGALWVGTFSSGLNRLENGTVQRFQNDPNRPSSLPANTVLDVHLTPDGILWVGTQKGLSRLDGKNSFKSYFESDGLPSAVINAVYSDAGGRLWLSTNKGISRFDPATETFKNFDVSHGLLSDEFNVGAHFQSPSGELIFGGTDGFNAFFPDRIEPNTTIPPVVLTSFEKSNQPVRLDQPIFDVTEIRLDHRDRVVSFEFAALDYTAPGRNRYRYQLEGFDNDWIDLGHRRRVSFTNLDPGSYVLRIMRTNNDEARNEASTTAGRDVTPPPWKTWWAYTLYILAAAALLGVGAFVYGQRQEVRRERAIASHERERVKERERLIQEREGLIEELEEKNAELERFTYTVSHDLKSPLVTIKGFVGLLRIDSDSGDAERMTEDVEMIENAADKMGTLLDDLLEFSRIGRMINSPEEVDLAEVAGSALENVGGHVAERGVEVEIAPDLPAVRGDRTQLYQVVQNLIQNALQYMGDHSAHGSFQDPICRIRSVFEEKPAVRLRIKSCRPPRGRHGSSRAGLGDVLPRAAILCCLLGHSAAAEDLRFDHLTVADGLAHASVWRIHQDSRGFLWIATESYLQRYDGYELVVYKNDPEDSGSISDSKVMAILEDRLGNMWFGTRSRGLNRYDRAEEHFDRYLSDPEDPGSLTPGRRRQAPRPLHQSRSEGVRLPGQGGQQRRGVE